MNKPIKTTAILILSLLLPLTALAAGGGWLILPLGLMLGGGMLLTVVLSKFKQMNNLAFVIMGIAMGIAANHMAATPEELDALFPGVFSINSGFQQIGIILILFMAGLQFNLDDITKRFQLVMINGIGFLGLSLLVFYGISAVLSLTQTFTEGIYFALCLSVPSGILVEAALKKSNTENSLHGQIVTGITVLSSVFAVILLVKLDASSSLEALSPAANVLNLWLTEQLLLLVVILLLLSRFVLRPVVRYLLRSAELLFVGNLGYCMGVAAICGHIGISPAAGAFIAGISVGVLPYRLDIVDKVGPLKSFGEILFFLSLGLEMAFIDRSVYSSGMGVTALLLAIVILGKPMMVMLTGFLSNLRGYSTFIIATTVNQSSEIALIVALLAWKGGIFHSQLFVVIVVVSLLSFIISAIGHLFQEKLYTICKPLFNFLNKYKTPEKLRAEYGFDCRNHVVFLSFNEVSAEIADFFKASHTDTLLITADPDIVQHFEKHRDSNIVPLYANISEKSVWDDYQLNQAKIVIACNGQRVELNRELAAYLNAAGVPFLAIADTSQDALDLYEAGVRYVIQPDYLASKTFRAVFAAEIDKPPGEAFKEKGRSHWGDTYSIRYHLGEIFKLV